MTTEIFSQYLALAASQSFDFSRTTFLILGLSAIVGMLIGVLINYLADVLPENRRLSRPVCSECEQPYNFKTYLFFQKCTNCGNKRPLRVTIVLIATAACAVLLRFFPFYTLGFWETLPLLLFLGVIAVIDIEHHIVLIQTSLIGIVLCLVYGGLMHGFTTALRGGLAGLLITLGLFLSGIVFTKFLGRLRGKSINQVAFGLGDVFAGTFLGLLAGGWPTIVGGIIAGILVFGAYSLIFLIVLISSKRYRAFASPQPFTPFLILGVLIVFYL